MTTSSTQLSLIIDDAQTNFFSFNPATSVLSSLTVFYQDSSHSSNATGDSNATFVDISFNGTSISIIGISAVPSSGSSDTFMVSIDGDTPQTTGYSDPNPPSYRQWYQSPVLSEGPHNISLSGVDLIASIDYAVITTSVSLATVVENGQVIIVDDTNPSIAYQSSDWTDTQQNFNSSSVFGAGSIFQPYGNSTHETSTVGSSFNYSFVGDGALAVLGVFDNRTPGFLNLTFTLDGNETTRDFATNITPSGIGILQPNFVFYANTANATSDGTHTLVVDLVDAQNLTFVLDYITFAPTSAPSVTATTHSTKSRVGDIIGGVLGGVGLLVLSFVAFDCFLRMKRKNTSRRRSFNYPFRTGPGFSTANDFPLSPTQYANKDASLST